MEQRKSLPHVKDLFFDLIGIEIQEFFLDNPSEDTLFNDADFPWEPLNKLNFLLSQIVDINPRKVTIESRKILVERNSDCLYPCVTDVYKQNPPYPYVDPKSLRLRGGFFLRCDGTAKLVGPAYIGPSVQVRHNGGILGYVLIGDGVSHNSEPSADDVGIGGIIGHGVTVRRSIIRSHTKIAAHTQIVDSIIGRNVFIDAGAQFPHENFSQKEISFSRLNAKPLDGGPIKTGRTKLGVIIGDNCFVGANVTSHPGTILMPGCRVPAGTDLQSGIYTPEYFES